MPISPKGGGGGTPDLGYVPGTEQLVEGTSTGICKHGDNRSNKSDIGDKAVDLSYSDDGATAKGASGAYAAAFGINTLASAYAACAEGSGSKATGMAAHAEGSTNVASGACAHSEGYGCTASGDYSHAEGESAVASGKASHAGGTSCTAAAWGSSVSGKGCSVDSSCTFSNVNGENNRLTASSYCASVCGTNNTITTSDMVNVSGFSNSLTNSAASIVGGNSHTVSGAHNALIAGASHTVSSKNSLTTGVGHSVQSAELGVFALGRYATVLNNGDLGKIGIGTSTSARADAFALYTDGTLTLPASTPALNYSRGSKAVVTKEQLDDRFEFGTVAITPSGANTPTQQAVTFTKTYTTAPFVTLTLMSSVPGTTVTGMAIAAAPTTTGFTAVITRTNTTATVIHWMATRV